MNSSILYHYTDAVGLAGIVNPSSWPVKYESNELAYGTAAKLWASDVRYMNDSSELKFGAEVFREQFRSASADPAVNTELREVFGKLASWFDPDRLFEWGLRCFATCLCEKGNLLSQWRGYAGGVGGYAVGFSWESIALNTWAFHPETTAMGTGTVPATLRRVVYGEDEATKAAIQFVQGVVSGSGFLVSGPDGKLDMFMLAASAFREIAAVKDPAFEQEHEWRLTTEGDVKYPANLRAGRSGLVPYLELAVNLGANSDAQPHRTIAELVVGPGPNQLAQVAAARELLRNHGHDPDVVVPSDIPFRG
ncbi:DUF2971 domain-containing protein [Rhodococcus opacus]|uniref:DUF2971 domain-containing protein n=1 Tax=Rhodococcus opacus TaxID=37919 RepID=UPI0029CAA0C9|nr:DUF2971 domain-containing protein [Rhodococcus opacus]